MPTPTLPDSGLMLVGTATTNPADLIPVSTPVENNKNIDSGDNTQPSSIGAGSHQQPPVTTTPPATTEPVVQQNSKDKVLSLEEFGEDIKSILSPTLKKDDKVVAQPATIQTTTTPAQTTTQDDLPLINEKQARDYSQFAPEDVDLLKRLPNKQFDYLKARLPILYAEQNKAKELQKQLEQVKGNILPESYYQHPGAYQLSPEYTQAAKMYNLATTEEQHWKSQLIRVKSGEKSVTIVTGYDAAGNAQTQQVEIKPEQQIAWETEIQGYMNNCGLERQKAQAQAGLVQSQFTNKYQAAANDLDAKFAKVFPNHAAIDKNGRASEYKQLMEQFVAPELRGHPSSDKLIKAGLFIKDVLAEFQKIKTENETLKSAQKDQQLAGPSGRTLNGGGGGGGARVLDIKEFGD